MIDKTSISKMAKKVFYHGRGLTDPQIMHPKREWLIGLVVMSIIFVASAVWSAQEYLRNKNVNVAEITGGVGSEAVYRDLQVKEALKIANDRNQELQALLQMQPTEPQDTEVPEAVVATTTTDAIPEVAEEGVPVDREVPEIGE